MKNKEELSVEEILTSIREVINNHHSSKISKKMNLDEDILELTEVRDTKAENDNITSSRHSRMQSLNDFVSRVSSNIDHRNTKSKDIRNSSLEELVVDIIKPEISSWLTDNLPNIVRQIVQKEIENLTKRKD